MEYLDDEKIGWVAEPEYSDEAVREKTGRGWDEWVSVIDAGAGRDAGHTATAAWVHEEQGIDAWWVQGITVGYERITGIRLPGQMPDGTFTVNRSRTLPDNVESARELFFDDKARGKLFPGMTTTLRSSPSAKRMRFDLIDDASGINSGILAFTVDPTKTGIKIFLTHEKLPSFEVAESWKTLWGEWVTQLEFPSR